MEIQICTYLLHIMLCNLFKIKYVGHITFFNNLSVAESAEPVLVPLHQEPKDKPQNTAADDVRYILSTCFYIIFIHVTVIS